jgi:sortase A
VSAAAARGAASRLLSLAGCLLIFTGACLSARALYLRGKAALAKVLIRRAWDETLRTGRATPPWPWADTHPIGRLVIPAIGYDEVVLEGASPRTLAFGPARLMNAAEPGAPGNLVLAGHRTSWFRPLQDVRPGQEVLIEWRDAAGAARRRAYRVTGTAVVDPADVRYLQPTQEDAVTLVTCFPFGRGPRSPQRYVVRATAAAS